MPFKDRAVNREYQRRWRATNRAEYLKDKCCAVCGSTENLNVDHIDPQKKIEHRVWTWSRERRETELKKCQVLCEKHHREKTRRDYEPPHGTHSRYVNRRCRCQPCRDAHAQTNALYR